MSVGLLGKKLGMTRVYNAQGVIIPVTVVDVSDNEIVQVKKASEKDGYNAVQVGIVPAKEKHLTKADLGHFKKHNAQPKRILKEFRVADEAALPAGKELTADVFPAGAIVDVIGVTKGKGFQGVVRRYRFAGQPASHGSMMHRRTGSLGCRLTPGLIWKNQKMPGHMGVRQRTTQNLVVVESRPDDKVLLIKGSIPGPKGGLIVIRPAKKQPATAGK